MTTLRQLPVMVSIEEYEVISQAMMLMKRQIQLGSTDGASLAAICRSWLRGRGVFVKQPTDEDAPA